MRERLDLPTVRALYDAWNEAPPAGLQLGRICSYLRAALGIRDAQPAPVRSASPALGQLNEHEQQWLASLPTAPPTRYLTPDEYYAQQESTRERP